MRRAAAAAGGQSLQIVANSDGPARGTHVQRLLEARNHGNSRNGTRSKTVITEIGPANIDEPRDRDGSFDPLRVRKSQRRLDEVDSGVISLTAKGLTTGEVEAHVAEVTQRTPPGKTRTCRSRVWYETRPARTVALVPRLQEAARVASV